MGKPRLYIRKFINMPRHHTVASVLACVDTRNVRFVLSDCTHTVELDFSAYSKSEYRNSIYKANQLIDIITQFRNAMVAEFEDGKRLRD